MTPREASMIEGQLLDPGEFPWQDSEAQMTAGQAKGQLKSAVADIAANELDASISAIQSIAMAAEQQRRKEENEQKKEIPPGDETHLMTLIDKIKQDDEQDGTLKHSQEE